MASPKSAVPQVQCPHCQMGNHPASPYCSRCGAPLAGLEARVESQVQPPATSDSQSLALFTADGQDPAQVRQAIDRAGTILTPGETVEYVAIAHRSGIVSAPDCAVASNKRVMLYRRKRLGKLEMDDCYWRDVSKAVTTEGRIGITLTLTSIQGWQIEIESLPREQAMRLSEVAASYSERLRPRSSAPLETVAEPAPSAVPAPERPTQTSTLIRPAGVPPLQPKPLGEITPLPPRNGQSVEAGMFVESDSSLMQAAASVPAHETRSPEPAAYEVTPEGVLHTLLYHQEGSSGAPTRPMQAQNAAAAFQAPSSGAQQVVFTPPDSELPVRDWPPLPTLERISVFSGGLGTPSGHLSNKSAPLGAPPRPSAPLDVDEVAVPTVGEPGEQFGLDLDDLYNSNVEGDVEFTGTAFELGHLAEEHDIGPGSDHDRGTMVLWAPSDSDPGDDEMDAAVEVDADEPTTRLAAGYHVPQRVSPPPQTPTLETGIPGPSGPLLPAHTSQPLTSPRVPQPAAQASERPSQPLVSMPEGGPLPVPGSYTSGPLLAASYDGPLDMPQPYEQIGGTLATQRLSTESVIDHLEHGTLSASQPRTEPRESEAAPLAHGQPAAAVAKQKEARPEADSGSVAPVKPAPTKSTTPRPVGGGDLMRKMIKLKALLDAGLITQEDYETKKAEMLSRL